MPAIDVDLFSDTLTRPTASMREAIASAEVGDEQLLEDPTVNALQEHVAELLGKEAALFLPSGLMCNQVAFAVHCRPGDEIILDATAHPVTHETGAPSALSGAQLRTLDGDRGRFTADQVRAAVRPLGRWFPRSRVLSVENTTNAGGGACWELGQVREVCDTAREHDLTCHLDGARLMNAVVATGVPASEWAASFDTAWIDLSKGLGAPVGAVIAGSADFIEQAWRFKQRFGGAMRQAGIIAAGGLYALRHHVDRLADDHANARRLADGLARIDGLTVTPPDTNIVVFDCSGTGMDAAAFNARMLDEHRIRCSSMGPNLVRMVTHLDVDADDIDLALDRIATMLEVGVAQG